MRHQNTIFRELINRIPWAEFDRLVEEHGSDRRVRRLDSRSQLIAMPFAQLSGADSLRAIVAGMKSQQARLYHLGAARPARSTLADANFRRPAALFGDLFAHMARAADRRTRRHMRDAVRILDATRVRLPGPMADWKAGASGAPAVKLHVAYDPDAAAPVEASVTSSLVNDITPARAARVVPGATYVFDLGYYSFEWWAGLHARGARFVTRLKRTTGLAEAEERTPPEGVLAERTGRLAGRWAASMPHPVREIVVRISTGKTIRLVTNDLDTPADQIADFYRERWQIELFFKWLKQNLRIRRFLGTSENAVLIQIFTALIAYLLLRRAHDEQTAIQRPGTFTKLVAMNLWHRRPINALADPPRPQAADPRQRTMDLLDA